MNYVLKLYFKGKVNKDEVDRNNLLKQIPRNESAHLCDIINAGEIAELEGEKRYGLLMFYAGETLDKMIREKGKLEPDIAKDYFFQMIDGLFTLYKYGLIHRDIRPLNTFVQNGHLTIGDFGNTIDQEAFELKDNRRYGAPNGYDGETADLFSAGLIYYEMLTGEHMIAARDLLDHNMDSRSYANLIEKLKKGFYDEQGDISEKYQDKIDALDAEPREIIYSCLKKDASIDHLTRKYEEYQMSQLTGKEI